ncbi:hypothetical protein NXX40_25525 (plasmid) [Parabacteroides distasonis]|nr:hypothetical protein [Parabacteroides distasonis]
MSDMKKKPGFLLKRINSFIIFTFPSITNVVRRCALQLLMSKQKTPGQADAEGSLTERNTENVKLLRGLRRTALLVLPAALPGMNL